MKIKSNLFLFAILGAGFLSCSKSNDNGQQPANPANPFGVLVQDDIPITSQFFITEAKNLGVPQVRLSVAMPNFAGSQSTNYSAALASNLNVSLNINYASSATQPNPFATDLTAYQSKLGAILDVYKPQLVVVENEPQTLQYHTGPMANYLTQLNAAITVAHAKGYKITDGGITSINLAVWQDYIDSGLTAKAQDFANRQFSAAIVADMPLLLNHPDLIFRIKQADTLIPAYKNMNLDYVNMHWYEPSRLAGGSNGVYYGNQAYGEGVAFLQRVTGKTVISNETGQLTVSPAIVTDLMQKAYDLKMPYCTWFDGDGIPAMALHNSDGTLRPNGIAFKNFIGSHY